MKILCVCKGNTCRSPMFATLLQLAFVNLGIEETKRPEVESAGVIEEAAGKPANEEWTTLLGETGVDLSAHRSRWIGNLDLASFDLILCMEPAVVGIVQEMAGGLDPRIQLVNETEGGIPNPYMKGTEAYRECFAVTRRVVEQLAPVIV